LSRVQELWRSVGALPEVLDAEEHDRRVAWTSHLPQLTSTALALALELAGHPRRELGPGGRDTTRLAASSPEMWTAICIDNADLLAGAVEEVEEQLARVREAIASRDREGIHEFFVRARRWAEEGPLPS
jgi:prephenate dehydrogenase